MCLITLNTVHVFTSLIRIFVNNYIEDMATFTALVKIYFTKYFCNAKVTGLGEFLSSKNSAIQYNSYTMYSCSAIIVPSLLQQEGCLSYSKAQQLNNSQKQKQNIMYMYMYIVGHVP